MIELFEPDHLYLELDGVAAEITMTGNKEGVNPEPLGGDN